VALAVVVGEEDSKEDMDIRATGAMEAMGATAMIRAMQDMGAMEAMVGTTAMATTMVASGMVAMIRTTDMEVSQITVKLKREGQLEAITHTIARQDQRH